jgi:hypothetical protein
MFAIYTQNIFLFFCFARRFSNYHADGDFLASYTLKNSQITYPTMTMDTIQRHALDIPLPCEPSRHKRNNMPHLLANPKAPHHSHPSDFERKFCNLSPAKTRNPNARDPPTIAKAQIPLGSQNSTHDTALRKITNFSRPFFLPPASVQLPEKAQSPSQTSP